jgi:hypothetical protein
MTRRAITELAQQAVPAVVTGAFVLAVSWTFPIGAPDPPLRSLVLVSFITMAVGGLALGCRTQPAWSTALFGLLGIVAGVMANATYDLLVHHIDHNLFPFEIVILATLLMPGLMVGVAIAYVVNRLRRR